MSSGTRDCDERQGDEVASSFTVEFQGDHEYVVRLNGDGEIVESWVRITPELLEQLGARIEDEEQLVRRTVEFLVRHQDVADLPEIIELEDVMASYDDFAQAISG
ncbi:MAG TPA: hypothetical protein VHF92_15100 [Geodermatophilus sp.]|nr:hypothetical protein [Geodermatophilus sp.]